MKIFYTHGNDGLTDTVGQLLQSLHSMTGKY